MFYQGKKNFKNSLIEIKTFSLSKAFMIAYSNVRNFWIYHKELLLLPKIPQKKILKDFYPLTLCLDSVIAQKVISVYCY